jgi:hypothetical protein
MFRIAAAWQRTPVEELTSEQFEAVKHWAVIALSLATAFATALAAIVSSLPERGLRPGKLKLALRGLAARWRKRLVIYRDVPGPIEFRDRMNIVYVPVDERGRVLNPDAKQL